MEPTNHRLNFNLEILNLLKDYFEKYPDYRFGQGLYNIGIATHLYGQDIFFEESFDTFQRLKFSDKDEVELETKL